MNVRKRGLALLMCICMIFTLLPFSAFADATEKASSITIEYWCTNTRVTGSDGNISKEVTPSSTAPQYLTNIAPGSGSGNNRSYVYWKTVVLPEGHHQDIKEGNNRSTDPKGVEILAIKQIDGKNYYFSVSKPDTAVLIKNDDQIVSYYKQVLVNSAEYGTITGSDWGNDKWSENATLNVSYFIVADNERVAEKSFFYNMSTKPEDTIKSIGIIPADGYKVVKLTVHSEGEEPITYTDDKLTSDTLVLDRASGKTVTYYLEKIVDLKVEYEWIFAPSSAELPINNTAYTKGATVPVDEKYSAVTKIDENGYTYKFSGWFFDTTYTNPAGESFPITQPTKLYGYWTPTPKEYNVTYTVTGDVPDGYTAPAASTAAFGSTVTVAAKPADDAYTDYTFSGWTCSDTDVIVTDGKFTMPAHDVEFTGTWTKIPTYGYTIECYWVGDKDKLLTDPVPGGAEVLAGEEFTLPVENYPDLPGYMPLEDQDASVTIVKDESQNVIKLYYSKNITVTPDSRTEIYDGTKYEIKTFKAITDIDRKDVAEDLDEEIIAYVGATNAGNYPVELFATSLMPQALDPEAEAPNSHLYVGQYIKKGYYYVEEIGKGYLTINKRHVTITGDNKEVYYNGTEQTFTTGYTVTGLADGHEVNEELLTHTLTGKEVNQYPGKFNLNKDQIEFYTLVDGKEKVYINAENYIVTLEPGTLTIKARPVTPPVIKHDLIITAGSKTGIAPVTCDEYTVEGLVNGDVVASVKITGSQNEPGESANVASDAVIKNSAGVDVTKNYNIKYVDGVLKAIEPLNKEDHFNYIIGIPDGTVKPLANISRAEVATIFFRLLTDEARDMYSVTTSSFSDVADGVWYTRAIATLANAGILKGDPAGTFRPADPITRAEMAAVIARFAKLDVNTKTFSDIEGHWAKDYIELAAGNGWINGTPEGEFQPDRNITRAETVAMINRVLDRQTENVSDLLPADQMTTWSDNMDTTQWYYKDMQEATNYHKCERVGDSIYEKWTEKLPEIDWASYQI